jgi:glycosyltransferase involved in cell wall biosynthesis
MSGFEENEISINSNGGTELSKRSIAKHVPKEIADEFQIIASRMRDIEEDKIRIYWVHDLADDPELEHLRDENVRNKFHKIVFVSHWQMNEFILKYNIPWTEQLCVIENPFEPIERHEKPTDKINLIYFSTPQRGLELLVPCFELLAEKHENIHLDVYSSFKIYGWEEADKSFEPLYDKIRNHDHMTYHGFAPQAELREALTKAHILAYPSIWPETSCRVLIESMSAGLLCVHPNLAALSETSAGLTNMYQFNQDKNVHANIFMSHLDHAINLAKNDLSSNSVQSYINLYKVYADTRFNESKISGQWNHLLEKMLIKFPNVESRKIPGKQFIYRTS